jgi:hypothetical protein
MSDVFSRLSKLVRNLHTIVSDCLSFFANLGRRRLALAAENLFLRKPVGSISAAREESDAHHALPTGLYLKLARCFIECGAD